MPGADKTLLKILERIKPAAKPKRKLSQAEEDLAMIAEELVAALGDGSSRGVADALRAAFGCMSDDKAKKYAEGGMVDDEEDEYGNEDDEMYYVEPEKQPIPEHKPDDPDYDAPYHDRWDNAYGFEYDLKDSSGTGKPMERVDENKETDWSMMYPEQRPDFDRDRLMSDREFAEQTRLENVAVDKRNIDAIAQYATDTGSYIGERIDPELMEIALGEPEKYVKVRSNPRAYKMFRDAYDAMAAEGDYDHQALYDMLDDPSFWEDAKSASFLSKEEYLKQQQQLQQEIYERMTPEQRAAYDAQRAIAEGQKPKLVELRDPNRNVTVLTDKPAKALRRQPTLKVVQKKPAAKPALPRTIQMGPLR